MGGLALENMNIRILMVSVISGLFPNCPSLGETSFPGHSCACHYTLISPDVTDTFQKIKTEREKTFLASSPLNALIWKAFLDPQKHLFHTLLSEETFCSLETYHFEKFPHFLVPQMSGKTSREPSLNPACSTALMKLPVNKSCWLPSIFKSDLLMKE